ncbi:MAG: lytic transglycosylase domain-containing protein [Vicinamibacteria bacterium]
MAARTKEEESKVFSLAERKPVEKLLTRPQKSKHGTLSRSRKSRFAWQPVAVVCLCLLLVTTTALALYAFHLVGTLRAETDVMMSRVESRMQRLDAAVQFDSKRQQMLLGIRDAIMEANPRIGLSDAYRYSDMILKASERYPSLEPLLLLAIGIVESGFDPDAVSAADARGLYQIWPSTGRMLARVLDWEYDEEMLFDPEKNTELAALYLDILFSAYNDERLVLAEYNGGPLNAGYLRMGGTLAASETRDYVAKVLDAHEGLKRRFERGSAIHLELMHRDRTRNDKRLWVPLRDVRPDVGSQAGN